MKERALMLVSRSPYPLVAGYKLRFHYIATLLQKRYEVDLLSLEAVRPGVKDGIPFRQVYEFPQPRGTFIVRSVTGFVHGWPLQVGGYWNAHAARWIEKHAAEYDLVYVHHVRMAPYAASVRSFKVLDYHDAISMHYATARSYAKGTWSLIYRLEGGRLRAYECEVLDSFSGAFVVSEKDRQWILNGKAQREIEDRLVVLPMGIRPQLLAYPPGQLEEASLAMMGNMRYYPNVDAATYFTREVLPLVQTRVPNVKFYVIGASPARAVRALAKLKNVIVTGYLDNPWQIVARAEVVVAPVRLGAGIQNKVLEAMALGKPVVGTTLALQGIAGGQDGEHFIVADSPEQMAEKIVDLLRDRHRARELGRRARTLVEEMYTWDRIGERLYEHLDGWKNSSGHSRPQCSKATTVRGVHTSADKA